MIDHLSATAIDNYMRCNRKFYLYKQYRTKIEAEYFTIGQLVHELLEISILNPNRVEKWLNDVPHRIQTTGIRPEREHYIVGFLRGIHTNFPYKIGIYDPEVEFSFPLYKKVYFGFQKKKIPLLNITGRFDGIQGNTIIEYKTTTYMKEFLKKLDTLYQAKLYWYSAKRLGIQNPVIKIFVIQKPQLRLRKNDTEAEYGKRIEESLQDKDRYFATESFSFDNYTFDEIEQELIDYVETITNDKKFIKNYNACNVYNGCEFLPICTQEPGWESKYYERED